MLRPPWRPTGASEASKNSNRKSEIRKSPKMLIKDELVIFDRKDIEFAIMFSQHREPSLGMRVARKEVE
jgi:hypothetical protein